MNTSAHQKQLYQYLQFYICSADQDLITLYFQLSFILKSNLQNEDFLLFLCKEKVGKRRGIKAFICQIKLDAMHSLKI